MEMGTGKSKVLVDNIAMLYDKGKNKCGVNYSTKGCYIETGFLKKYQIFTRHIDHKTVLWTATTSKAKDKEYQQLFKIDL